MVEEGKYVYCIIKESKPRNFGYIGINNREVTLVHCKHCKDIAAVVSNSPVINFDRLNKKELTMYVAVHQKVNEQVMKDCDVVPMTFGIIAPNIAEVSGILEKAYLQFKTALKTIKGKAEFVVQARWDQKKLIEELTNTNPEIRKLKQETALKANVLRMPIKLKLGKLLQEGMEAYREAFIKDIQQVLGKLARDSTQNKLIDEDMIANFSFLIDRLKESELDRKMIELGKKYEGKLRFKYIGPMPPYSFVNINLSLGNFELVNEARRLLNLGEVATFDEIKKAYYALAHQYHPDKHKGKEKEEQMKKIAKAYSILESYCQSCDELAPPSKHKKINTYGIEGRVKRKVEEPRYSFKEEDVKNSLIIS